MASHAQPLRIEALVAGQIQVLELTSEKNARREWTVRGDVFPALSAELVTVAAAASSEPQVLPALGNAIPDLELVQVEPQSYSQRLVKATTVRGRIAEGRFAGLDNEGRLVIRREMSGVEEASYLLCPAEITRLELLECQSSHDGARPFCINA